MNYKKQLNNQLQQLKNKKEVAVGNTDTLCLCKGAIAYLNWCNDLNLDATFQTANDYFGAKNLKEGNSNKTYNNYALNEILSLIMRYENIGNMHNE